MAVLDEELGHDVIKEAFEEFGIAYRKQDVKDKKEIMRLLTYQEGEVVEMEHSISELEEMVAKWKGGWERKSSKMMMVMTFLLITTMMVMTKW